MGSVRGLISGRLHWSMVLEFDRKPSMFYFMSHSKLRLWQRCAFRRTNNCTSSVWQSLRRYAYFQFDWSIRCSAPVVGLDLRFSVVASSASHSVLFVVIALRIPCFSMWRCVVCRKLIFYNMVGDSCVRCSLNIWLWQPWLSDFGCTTGVACAELFVIWVNLDELTVWLWQYPEQLTLVASLPIQFRQWSLWMHQTAEIVQNIWVSHVFNLLCHLHDFGNVLDHSAL